MMDHNETLEFIKRAQKGDEEAKNKLVEHNIPLIKSIIKRYINKYIEYDDLMQLGCMGLLKAINNFNTDYNVRFSTYAVPMISGEIKRFIRDDGSIKVSRSLKMTASKINMYIEEKKKRDNKDPTIEEIAEDFHMDVADVVFTMDSQRMPLSLYSGSDSNNDKTPSLIDKLAVSDDSDELIDKMILKDTLKSLSERERQIILLRYYRDKTQSEIATILGVSQVQISRLETKILEKIKKQLKE